MRILFTLLAAALLAMPAMADDTKACAPLYLEINPTEAQATDDFVNLTDGTIGTTFAAEDDAVAPADIVVSDISAVIDVAPGANDSWRIYVTDGVNGARSSRYCEIADTNTSCHAAADVVVAGRDVWAITVDSGEGAGVPATSATLKISACVRKR